MALFLFVSKDCFHPISYHCLPKNIKKYLTCIYSSIVNVSLILYGGVICVYFLLCSFFVYFFDKACQFLFYLSVFCYCMSNVLNDSMNKRILVILNLTQNIASSLLILKQCSRFLLCVRAWKISEQQKKNDKNCVVQGALYQIICLSLLHLNPNKICVFIIWIIHVSVLFAWYDFVLYFVFFHSPDVPNTLLPTIIPSLTTATATTSVAITTCPTTSATTSSTRGTVCFFVMACKTRGIEIYRAYFFTRVEELRFNFTYW